MTDAELSEDLALGLSSPQIATKRGISPQAVNKRRRRLRSDATAVVVVAHAESRRLVAAELDTIELLHESMLRLQMLSDAYHEWLLDPDDSTRYVIGPRATEIDVVYYEPDAEKPKRRKAKLQTLLNKLSKMALVDSMKYKGADPRAELRATVGTISATVAQMVRLAQMLADQRAMETLRDAILDELRQVAPDVAARIAVRLRSRFVVGGLPGRP
jgi:hypothetical protein